MNIIILYHFLSIILFPFYILLLLFRLARGRENIGSIKSRFGIYNTPKSAKDLIWIHAASVGESMIAIKLVNELGKNYKNMQFLITTGTISSAGIVKKLAPSYVFHEFIPIDNLFTVNKFYKYWQPNIGIFIESELWPGILSVGSRYCKLLLLNARLSDKSFAKWSKFPKIFLAISRYFTFIVAQSDSDFKKYKKLGCVHLQNLGNLKFANQELTVNNIDQKLLSKIFTSKKVFVASSTHVEDEDIILNLIYKLQNSKTNTYPIVVLRHPERKNEIISYCKKLGLKYSLRSEQKSPDIKEDLYIVDSFGELGLFYSIADIVFIGGSFKRGGHNLLEPAYFDNVIIFGPDMSNFQNIADEMIQKKAAIQIQDSVDLENKIMFFMNDQNSKIALEYIKNAKQYVTNRKQILDDYLKLIEETINIKNQLM